MPPSMPARRSRIALFHFRHPEITGACRTKGKGCLFQAVAIGLRLDHGQNLHLIGQQFSDLPEIMLQIVEVDFDPIDGRD